ncbi:hypothetical protein G7085_13640 [Tessaracoccus sp. HDW20]|uniref:hypothetical protein n=1 Tax=Tessaracoccus coleopterorum TaxID=2714950 RepID=UPI0018D43EFF|nr:hypothetical protein [Tessaracoccus coleopterorum]NHB85314.1 hypothetical protein [Tessaracoccus coleopterorum]
MEQLASLNTLIDRLLATRSLAISDADRRRVAEAATGLTMAVWLKSTRRATKGEATGIIFAGHDLAAHPEVGRAAVDGRSRPGRPRVSRRCSTISRPG